MTRILSLLVLKFPPLPGMGGREMGEGPGVRAAFREALP
jgi:hypothetical protein